MKSRLTIFLTISSIAFITGCVPPPMEPTPTPTAVFTTSQEFITAAWNAFNNNQFTEAISFAQEVINRWEGEAIKQQASLTQAPPIGVPAGEEEKKAILSNWALNDVAAAYFVKAWSFEKLGKPNEAKAAYYKVLEFSYGRCWDPQGWFWSPAEEAQRRLSRIP